MTHPTTKPAATTTPTPDQDKPTRHDDDALDEALKESFPSSDPIAVTVTKDDPPKR